MKNVNPYKKVGKYPIPFDFKGNQLHYPTSYTTDNVDRINELRKPYAAISEQWMTFWLPNRPFGGSYKFTSIARGRSAAYFEIKSVNDDREATMFMKDVLEAMPYFVRGFLNGTFCFTKRGANYGIKFLHEGEPEHDAILEQFGPEGK